MSFKYIGKPLPIADAASKVTGQLIYTGDMKFPGMLYGKLLFSPLPHAIIKSIDTSEAEKLPGVKAIVTHLNSPQVCFNSALRFIDHGVKEDEMVFSPIVRYVGDRVTAVAAVDQETAAKAVKLIKVEYEELPAIFDPEAALVDGSPLVHSEGNLLKRITSQCGNFEHALQEADIIVEDRVTTPAVHHCAIELHTCIAHWVNNQKLTVWTTNQNVFATRLILAKIFGLTLNKVRVIKPPIGGAFGGKLEAVLEPVASLLAQRTGCPVKVVLNRSEAMVSTRTRHAAITYLKTAVKKDGTIVGQEIKVITNIGAYASSGTNVLGAMSGKAFRLYRIPNMRFIGLPVYTNTPVAGAMRGYGSPQLVAAIEIHMDHIAKLLNLDPLEIRKKNLVRPYDLDPRDNKSIGNCRIYDCIVKGAEQIRWHNRKSEHDEFHKIGFGIGCGIHGNGVYPAHRDITTMTLKLNEDGSATLLTGTHDLGAGTNTIFKQIIGEVLHIYPDMIEIVESDTEINAYDLGAYASRNTWVGGAAAKKAAEKVLGQLKLIATEILNISLENIIIADGYFSTNNASSRKLSIKDITTYSQRVKQKEIIDSVSYHSPAGPSSYGAHFAKVRVNINSGEVQVLEYVAVHDVGKAINPLLLEGQIHGGIQMGIGFAVSEELILDRNTGRIVNATLKKYKVAKAKDMPNTKVFFVEELEEPGPFGAKSIGEIATVPVAPAIINAINDALGTRFTQLPITPEKILAAIKGKYSKRC